MRRFILIVVVLGIIGSCQTSSQERPLSALDQVSNEVDSAVLAEYVLPPGPPPQPLPPCGKDDLVGVGIMTRTQMPDEGWVAEFYSADGHRAKLLPPTKRQKFFCRELANDNSQWREKDDYCERVYSINYSRPEIPLIVLEDNNAVRVAVTGNWRTKQPNGNDATVCFPWLGGKECYADPFYAPDEIKNADGSSTLICDNSVLLQK